MEKKDIGFRFLIDIGSSTVKAYKQQYNSVILLEQKTLDFKEGFSRSEGLSSYNYTQLISYLSYLAKKYSLTNRNTKLFATGVFRDIIDPKPIVESVFRNTGLYFNIISHNLEAFYLEKAWVNDDCNLVNRMIVINIGGKTTELLLCEAGKVVDRPQKIPIGVGTVLKRHPEINDNYSAYSIDSLVNEITVDLENHLAKTRGSYNVAIYTGGELNYMRCAEYPLIHNDLFADQKHPNMIKATDYFRKNHEIFTSISLDELKAMMPNNPEWMGGARACSAIAQAIMQYFHVDVIIPSDSNMIDGVNIQEAKNVVICGSFNKHLQQIRQLIQSLNNKGISVLSPKSTEVVGSEGDFVLFKEDIIENHNTWSIEEVHLKAMDQCDFVIACNYDNYIGVSTTFELEHAYRANKKIVFVEDNEIADSFGRRINVFPMPCEIGLL